MAGNLSFDQLKKAVAAGDIDTVLGCAVDMQGRLIGKRFLASYFVESAYDETHGCNYLLANDIDMEPVPGYKAASWAKGYGDFVMKPDLSTIRDVPWLEKTALVLCDLQDHHTHEDLPHSPRGILRRQVARLKERGYLAYFASELEFYLFDETYDSARAKHWQGLDTASPYIGDYLIGITTKEEGVMRRLRNEMEAAGIPIENSKGEWGPGQEEINVRYAEALDMADRHVILKNGAKEIACAGRQGDLLHGEVQLRPRRQFQPHPQFAVERRRQDAAVLRQEGDWTLSTLGQQWSAGQLKYAKEFTWFLAPYINSYKRFQSGTFAPTKIMWSRRQPHRRLPAVRRGHQGHPHGMPHRRRRPQPLSRLRGADRGGPRRHRREARAAEAVRRRRLSGGDLPEIPKTLREATETLAKSKMLKAAFGDDVIEHYVHTARWEQFEYDRRITDWELHRGFERY